jgi:hypothetical protein
MTTTTTDKLYTIRLTGAQVELLSSALSAAWCRWNAEAASDRAAGLPAEAQASESVRDQLGDLHYDDAIQGPLTAVRKDAYRKRGELDALAGRAPQPPHVGQTDRVLAGYRASYWLGYKRALPNE